MQQEAAVNGAAKHHKEEATAVAAEGNKPQVATRSKVERQEAAAEAGRQRRIAESAMASAKQIVASRKTAQGPAGFAASSPAGAQKAKQLKATEDSERRKTLQEALKGQ